MSRSTARRGATVALVALAIGTATACSDDEPTSAPAASTTTASATASTTSAPTPTPTMPPPATSTATVSATPKPSATASATATATAAPTPTVTAAARWPKAVGQPQQRESVWAVYLAVANSSSDPALDKAVRQAASVGYQAITGDVACDDGAMEALGLDQFDVWSAASLYFATGADAKAFAAAYTAEVTAPQGVARVRLGCLD